MIQSSVDRTEFPNPEEPTELDVILIRKRPKCNSNSLHTKVKMCDNLFAVDGGVVVNIYIDIDIYNVWWCGCKYLGQRHVFNFNLKTNL